MVTIESIIIGLVLLSTAIILWVRLRALETEQRTRYEVSTPAMALIIEAQTLESESPDQSIPMLLRFWIEPPGGVPFKARALWLINSNRLSMVRTGQSFPVRIDAITNEVIFPNVDWAKYDWQHAYAFAGSRQDTRPVKK